MPVPDQGRLFEAPAYADPAVSWCVMIGCAAGCSSSFLDDAAGRELWPELDMVTAGWVAPAGRARSIDGGFLVDGRWSFGSGCTHADVLVGGCTVVDHDGRSDLDTTGLAGSGSDDDTCPTSSCRRRTRAR